MKFDLLPELVRVGLMLSAGAALWIYRREIEDAFNRFNGRGPRPPCHPLPVQKKPGRSAKTERKGGSGVESVAHGKTTTMTEHDVQVAKPIIAVSIVGPT